MDNEGIDEIMERLWRGETLMIDDQMRSYISFESDDMPARFVMRSALAKDIETTDPRFEEKRFRSLAEALLSLTDYTWC